MTKRYNPLVDYGSIDYLIALNEIEAHVVACYLSIFELLQNCGVASEDIDMDRLTTDLIATLTYFALNCNANPTRGPKIIFATVQAIGQDPEEFLKKSHEYDPVAEAMVLATTAGFSRRNAFQVFQHWVGKGPGPGPEEISKAVPLVLQELAKEAKNSEKGRPRTFQGQFAIELGKIFKAQGGFLGRDTKSLNKTPFRQFVELIIALKALRGVASRAGISLNPITMVSTARKALEPNLST